jgi:hypothetical protein
MFAQHAFGGGKCLFEYASCSVLVIIGTVLQNKLIEMTGRALGVGCSRDAVASQRLFLYVISKANNRLTMEHNFLEFATPIPKRIFEKM